MFQLSELYAANKKDVRLATIRGKRTFGSANLLLLKLYLSSARAVG
jgi:hypothetical protein